MDTEGLKKRTKEFGLRVIKLTGALPSSRAAAVIGRQLLRSGTSVGASYRSACRARTKPDFVSKAGMAIEQADESLYWMEMLAAAGIMPKDKMAGLMKEAEELIALLTAAAKAARLPVKSRRPG
jgi:four helix bundle protein